MFDVNLVELPKKILRKKSQDVKVPLNKTNELLVQKMIYHIDSSQKLNSHFRAGVGVAAVQYGILKNIFYVNIPNNKNEMQPLVRDAIINPRLIWKSSELIAIHSGEGCLSVNESWPHQEGLIRRALSIKVRAYSYFQKKEVVYALSGYAAIVFQHELDHLNGKLFIDHIKKNDLWNSENVTLI